MWASGFPQALLGKYEYDYGQLPPNPSLPPSGSNIGTATRTTAYNWYGIFHPCLYLSAQTSPDPCSQSTNWLSRSGSVPSQIVTYAGNATYNSTNNTWSGTRIAEADAYHDGNTTLGGSGTSPVTLPVNGGALPPGTHDETNYGSTPPAVTAAAPYITRGNLTKLVRWSSTGALPSKTYTYDETGQVLSMIDACGNSTCTDITGSNHTTTYSYADSPSGGNPAGNSNAYLAVKSSTQPPQAASSR